MLQIIDGKVVIRDVERNLTAYYEDYVGEFGAISRTQWNGSDEYKVAYVNAQRDHSNAVLMNLALQKTLESINQNNEKINRPAVLYSRVAERFAEEGWIGGVSKPEDSETGTTFVFDYTPEFANTPSNNLLIAKLIGDEMLGAGCFMLGDISAFYAIPDESGSVEIFWKEPNAHTIDFKLEITIDPASLSPSDDVETIVEKFNNNWNAANKLGADITPQKYFQIERDAPYASNIKVSYDIDSSGTFVTDIYSAAFDDKFVGQLQNADVSFL